MQIKRGDVILVNLDPVVGSEQGKTRPALIVQNDIGNEYSPTTIVAPITSKIFSKQFPTNVEIDLEMKRKTLKSCEKLIPKLNKLGPSWQRDNDVISWLSRL